MYKRNCLQTFSVAMDLNSFFKMFSIPFEQIFPETPNFLEQTFLFKIILQNSSFCWDLENTGAIFGPLRNLSDVTWLYVCSSCSVYWSRLLTKSGWLTKKSSDQVNEIPNGYYIGVCFIILFIFSDFNEVRILFLLDLFRSI